MSAETYDEAPKQAPRPSSLWSSETIALLGMENPVELHCSAFEISFDDLIPPFDELIHIRQAAKESAFQKRDDLDRLINELCSHAGTLDLDGLRLGISRISDANAAREEAEIGVRYNHTESEALDRWFANLTGWEDDGSTLVDFVPYLNEGDAERRVSGLLELYAHRLRSSPSPHAPTKAQRTDIIEALPTLPVPIFGSAPKEIVPLEAIGQRISKAARGGSFLGIVFMSYETGGVSLAILTAGTGVVVWFATPAAQVARQFSKNWLSEKLGVTDIEN